MKFLVPQGIGDSIWAMHKVQSIVAEKDNVVDIRIAVYNTNLLESRAADFLRRFKFVNTVYLYTVPRQPGKHGPVLLPGPCADSNGHYRYIADGPTDWDQIDYVLMPNAPLERGIRLENWLPQYATNWNIMDDFMLSQKEVDFAKELKEKLGSYIVFYLGPEGGNTGAGHNRGPIWKPEHWVELGNKLVDKYGCKIVVVGADYDRNYHDNYVKPLLGNLQEHWHEYIGSWHIAKTYSVILQSRFVVSYQSGIGIVSSYLGIPTAIFWRAKGDSIDPNNYVSFEEDMSHAWTNPKMIEQGKHLPLIYGRHDVDYLVSEIDKRGW